MRMANRSRERKTLSAYDEKIDHLKSVMLILVLVFVSPVVEKSLVLFV